jgi:hypothetical protein
MAKSEENQSRKKKEKLTNAVESGNLEEKMLGGFLLSRLQTVKEKSNDED